MVLNLGCMVWFGLVWFTLAFANSWMGRRVLMAHCLRLSRISSSLSLLKVGSKSALCQTKQRFRRQRAVSPNKRIHRQEAFKRSMQGSLCALCGEEESTGGNHIVADLTLNPEDEERRRSVCSPPGPVTGVFAPSSASVRCRRRRP